MKHRAVIIGAGRVGACYQWPDREYTHAGAYQVLRDRVELVGFIESNEERAQSAKLKWHVPVYEDVPTGLMALRPDIISICVQPEQQQDVYLQLELSGIKGIWQEKPFVVDTDAAELVPIQVNYLRRGDPIHRKLAYDLIPRRKEVKLVVYGKDDIHTRCHFDDLSKWWGVEMDYRPFNGPCAYAVGKMFFDNGGVNPGECMKNMLENLLEHVDHGMTLWSPA